MMDFSTYTDDELTTLQHQVANELNARKTRELVSAQNDVMGALRKFFKLGGQIIIGGDVCELWCIDQLTCDDPGVIVTE